MEALDSRPNFLLVDAWLGLLLFSSDGSEKMADAAPSGRGGIEDELIGAAMQISELRQESKGLRRDLAASQSQVSRYATGEQEEGWGRGIQCNLVLTLSFAAGGAIRVFLGG